MKRIAVITLAFLFMLQVNALDWPSPEGIISGNFGWNSGGRPLLGMSFIAEGDIEASGAGEVLFRGGTGNGPSRLPSPLGEWVALDHGDGIISVYSRMDKENETGNAAQVRIEERTPLGQAGISGWSSSKGFYFFLFDRKERRWINPLMIVNPKPDERPPVIQSVRLHSEDGTAIDPSVTRVLSQGLYMISVTAADTMMAADERPLAPFRILCSVNGVETGALNFETYQARDGSLMVYRNGLVPVKEAFAPQPGWEVGEIRLTRGQATLEVIVQDFSGNSRNALYRLQIE